MIFLIGLIVCLIYICGAYCAYRFGRDDFLRRISNIYARDLYIDGERKVFCITVIEYHGAEYIAIRGVNDNDEVVLKDKTFFDLLYKGKAKHPNLNIWYILRD